MKIISIGTDEKVLDNNSRVYNRIKEYAQIFEQYYVFVFTKNLDAKEIVENNFKVIPVIYRNKFFSVVNLINKIRQEKIEQVEKKDVIVYSQDAFEVGLLSFLISKVFNYKLILQIHTDVSSKYFRYESLRNFLLLQGHGR